MFLNYLQGKGDILTYWLISENKQKRLRRLESLYLNTVPQGYSLCKSSTSNGIIDDMITFQTSVDSSYNQNIVQTICSPSNNKGLTEECDVKTNLCDSHSEDNMIRASSSEGPCSEHHTRIQKRNRNDRARVEMRPLLDQLTKEIEFPATVNL